MADPRPVVLKLEGITKRFGTLTANDAIGFALHQGEVLALLGENGAGKTTLMNILFGHYTADAGTVEVMGQALPPGQPGAALAAGVGMVHQHFTLADNLTVTENILIGTRPLWRGGLGRAEARARIAALSRDFGLAVHPEAKVRTLSVGECQRVEILKALYREARVLILDEPTAVLTPQETEALFATLKKAVDRGLSIIFISHKLHEVMAVSDRVIVLRHGRVAGEVATAETDRHRLAEMMVGAEVRLPAPSLARPGSALMELDAVSTPPEGTRPGLKSVSLALRAGQITGLAGVSGNGQGALADLVSGLAAPSAGRFEVAGARVERWSPRAALQAGVGRIPEDRHATGSIADFTLTENAVLEDYARPPYSRRGWMNWRAARAHAEKIIKDYDVRCPGPEARIRLLSGGNMQKLILGRALETAPRIILANQPVRGLDIGALTYVQDRLIAARDGGAAVLLISEDLDEILALSDVIHVMSEGRLSPGFPRGTKTPAELGVWMAGQGFDHAA
ncbi:ABC transporter ATP-binding protein [Rhodovulum sp. BSW8]|uniref:ABC transporter ATP-binding protein n=1 Tax=Rhodovulum visakhapatnamense TaxID=364297 RepID=A0A4R8G435_9RHOB|nr:MULTISPECIES: ABC transporter ATP-binding protein [Rhodovulum]OLS43946.1 sugar ABC transporter ATP-binding protein [Rhodovulum sulfidophilum]MBL3570376.1 ABC transporter ATP-binding protein [Rhodovulum visakhapatnamense]MBL3576844.1 ABC transporter ATP-binding protein [Rhodovulum visakhapatnamense]RBO51453.1 ABC transporter ATP-binding protein [Rhodovulum sp. BSW8]TDX31365.1 nucleoside ABC transporter ATP-binding protein [Rhodovulum visakhapatnamense]